MLRSIARLLLGVQVCLLLAPLCCFTSSAEIGDDGQAELVWTMQDMVEEDEKAAEWPGTESGPGQLELCWRPLAMCLLHAVSARCALPLCYQADVPSPPPLSA